MGETSGIRRDPAPAGSGWASAARRAPRPPAASITHNAPAASRSRAISAKGLRPRSLSRRSLRSVSVVERVGREMEPAETLHGDDGPAGEGGDGLEDRVAAARPSAGVEQRQPRAALGAAERLGVESPVRGIAVLGQAPVAEGEVGHRRAFPVERRAFNDRVPGPALGAADEGVEVPTVRGVEQLPAAVGAQGEIGRDRRELPVGGSALADGELRAPCGRRGSSGSSSHRVEPGCGREHCRERVAEGCDAIRRALDLGHHLGGAVLDEAREPEPRRQPVHRRAESDALDHCPGNAGASHGAGADRRTPWRAV